VIEALAILQTLDKRMGRFLFNRKLLYFEILWILEMLTVQNHLNNPDTSRPSRATFMPLGKTFLESKLNAAQRRS
jgi:hypothetical protein